MGLSENLYLPVTIFVKTDLVWEGIFDRCPWGNQLDLKNYSILRNIVIEKLKSNGANVLFEVAIDVKPIEFLESA